MPRDRDGMSGGEPEYITGHTRKVLAVTAPHQYEAWLDPYKAVPPSPDPFIDLFARGPAVSADAAH